MIINLTFSEGASYDWQLIINTCYFCFKHFPLLFVDKKKLLPVLFGFVKSNNLYKCKVKRLLSAQWGSLL